jgi:hypothetical protein
MFLPCWDAILNVPDAILNVPDENLWRRMGTDNRLKLKMPLSRNKIAINNPDFEKLLSNR